MMREGGGGIGGRVMRGWGGGKGDVLRHCVM